MKTKKPVVPVCPYCSTHANFMEDTAPLYHGRNYGPAWVCMPCEAWVGVHQGGRIPLGRLANKELRVAKQAAHLAFDPLWKTKLERGECSKGQARQAAYSWLSHALDIRPDQTHIGMFDVETCRRVIKVCNSINERKAA